MKTNSFLTLTLVSTLCLSSGFSYAADNDAPRRKAGERQVDAKRDQTAQNKQRMEARMQSLQRALKATEIDGKEVVNRSGEKLGKVEDMVLDLQNGTVSYLIVSSGGVLGVGGKLVAVPAPRFSVSADKGSLVLDVPADRFAKAPNFDSQTYPKMEDKAWAEVVQNYFDTDKDASKIDRPLVPDVAPAKRIGYMHSDKLMGMDVVSLSGEKLGDLKDLIVDVEAGKVIEALIDPGLGSKAQKRVPPEAFQAGADKDHLYLNADKARLEGAPSYTENESRDVSAWQKVYAWFDLSPLWEKGGELGPQGEKGLNRNATLNNDETRRPVREKTTLDNDVDRTKGPGRDVNNTRLNERDRDGRTVTPFDQSNSAKDTQITAAIRKWIVVEPGADRFSGEAHNIKIVTREGAVTLRGTVENAGEKERIETYAKQVQGVKSVDNQLEVKKD